jgi:hypothetical protein
MALMFLLVLIICLVYVSIMLLRTAYERDYILRCILNYEADEVAYVTRIHLFRDFATVPFSTHFWELLLLANPLEIYSVTIENLVVKHRKAKNNG